MARGIGKACCTALALLAASSALAEEQARGVVRAKREATLSTELNARIAELPLKEGDRFEAGGLLVAFECERYRADLRAAEAELRSHEITLQNGQALQKRGALGAFENDLNKTKVDKAKAAVDGLAARLVDCRIEAPFAGRVAEIKVRRYEMTAPNAVLMRIVDDSEPEIDLIVPSMWLAWLAAGVSFRVKVDETSAWHEAVLLRLPATVDAVSQTARITGALKGAGSSVLPGMSVTAVFARAGG
jgi:RND family efflux transporter MFP subunit